MDYLKNVLSQYSPFSSLLQYIFQRILGKYLQTNVSLSNFAMGTCNLSNLDLACDKLNQNLLQGQPFSLFKGHISRFQLKIPWTRILQESIEIRIEGLELWMLLEDFDDERFKNGKDAEKNPLDETISEELYDTKVDVFKKIVNKILLNMTIDIADIKIRVFNKRSDLQRYMLFMTEEVDFSEAEENTENTQRLPCLLLKINSYSVKKKKNEVNLLKSSSFLFDDIEDYFIDFSEVSAHLLDDPSEEKSETFSNIKIDKNRVSFQSPSISFPGTFLVISNGFSVHLQKKKLSDEVVKLSILLGAVELTLDPKEVGVLKEVSEKIGKFNERKGEVVLEMLQNEKDANSNPTLQRNRSLSNIVASPEKPEMTKESKILRKLSLKHGDSSFNNQTNASTLAKNNNNGNNLNTSIKLAPHEISIHNTTIPNKPKNEEKMETDLLKVLIIDYIKSSNENSNEKNKNEKQGNLIGKAKNLPNEKNPEFTIEIFSKPSVVQLNNANVIPKQPDHPDKKISNPSPISPTEEQLLLTQAEVLFATSNNENSRKTSPASFKFELILNRFALVLPSSARNQGLQDPFAKTWLFAKDPYLLNPNQDQNIKYNLGSPQDTMQLHINDLIVRSKNQKEIKGSINKIRAFFVKLQEDNVEKSGNFEEESELFHSAQCSLTMSFLHPRKLERKLVFFQRKQPVFIKEIIRITPGKSSNKSLFKNSLKTQGVLIERPFGVVLSSSKEKKTHEDSEFAMNFAFKPSVQSLEINLNPIFISLDLFKLAFLMNFLSLVPQNKSNQYQNLKESHLNLSKSLTLSKHLSKRKPEKTQEISFNLTCDLISLDFEDINLLIQDNFLSKPPLFGFFKASFSRLSLNICHRDFQTSEALCYPLLVIDEDAITRKNSFFFEGGNQCFLTEKNQEQENQEFQKDNYLEILGKKTKFGVFLNNMKVYCYLETLITLKKTIETFTNKMSKFQLAFDQKQEELPIDPQKKAIVFSLILEKVYIILNNDALKPNIYSKLGLTLSDYTPSEDSLKKSLTLRLYNIQIFASPSMQNISLAIEDLLFVDLHAKQVALDCPLKLVQGSSFEERRKTLKGSFAEKLNDVERLEGVIIYKQGVFHQGKNTEKNLEFFSDFRTLASKTSAIKVKVTNGKSFHICLKGFVVKQGVIEEKIQKKVASFVDALSNINNNEKEESKDNWNSLINQKAPSSNIRSENQKAVAMHFVIEVLDFAFDFFPSYLPLHVLQNPELFNFRHCDLDPKKQGHFFFNTRSIVMFSGVKVEFGYKESQMRMDALQIEKVRAVLLQFFDFDAVTNPLIFGEFSQELGVFYGTILEKLGFVPVFELQQLEFRLLPLKSLMISSISVDSCSDTLKTLSRHISSVMISVSPSNKIGKPNEKAEKKLQKKESFVVIDEQELMEQEFQESAAIQMVHNFLSMNAQGLLHTYLGNENSLENVIKIKITSFSVNLYDGVDFEFLAREKAPDLESSVKSEEMEGKSMNMVIVEDYFSNNSGKKQAKNQKKNEDYLRKRCRARCLQKFIAIICENMSFSLFEFEETRFKAAFSIGNFEVLDSINTSTIKKILIEDSSKDFSLEKSREFLIMVLEGDKKEKEAKFFLKPGDLKLFFNGVNVEFLMDFLSSSGGTKEEEELYWMNEYYGQNLRSEKMEEEEDERIRKPFGFFASHPNIYSQDFKREEVFEFESDENKEGTMKLSLVSIGAFNITVDYDATFSNLNRVLENSLNFLNIGNINSLKLFFKEILLKDEKLSPELVLKITDSYKNDIILNQKPNIIKKLPYINNLFNVLEGFANIFYLPYKEAVHGRSIEKGFLKGIGSFAKAVSIEGLNFTEVLAKGLGFGLKQLGVDRRKKGRFLEGMIENVRGKIDPNEKEKKEEKYKKN